MEQRLQEINDRIVSYSLLADGIVPKGSPETIVSKLPLGGDHPMHPFIIGADGSMYVDVATATNSCQPKNRQPKIPGDNPCTELETRGGVWRFDANKTDQMFSPAELSQSPLGTVFTPNPVRNGALHWGWAGRKRDSKVKIAAR